MIDYDIGDLQIIRTIYVQIGGMDLTAYDDRTEPKIDREPTPRHVIAKALGMSVQDVENVEKQALRKCREMWNR